MTNVTFKDSRVENAPTFGQLAVGQWFICEGQLFCKTEPLLSKTATDHYNAFNPYESRFEVFGDEEWVAPIESVRIEILK